jgi:hypothetical protein
VALVDVQREERKPKRRAAPELAQKMEQGVRIFAAAHGDEHAIAWLEQAEILARSGDVREQAVLEAAHGTLDSSREIHVSATSW